MFKNRLHDNRGGALVELALTIPFLIFTTLGGAELARVAYFAIELTGAARAGASYASQNVVYASEPANIEAAAQDEVPNITLDWASAGPPAVAGAAAPTTACVCETIPTNGTATSYYPSSGTTSCTDPKIISCTGLTTTDTFTVVEYTSVATQAKLPAMFNLSAFGIQSSYTLQGFATMRVLQN